MSGKSADSSRATKRKRPDRRAVWREARQVVAEHRGRLMLGLGLMLVGRLAAMVPPATSKFLIDDVIANGRGELLKWLALAAGVAALIQACTTFSLSQILGVAAQRAINDMRKRLHSHAMHLPVRYFDKTQSGVMISRIMTDAEGLRNLVGNGLVQLVGGLATAAFALVILLYLNWMLTLIMIGVLAVFGGGMAFAFSRLRPLFKQRREINAEVTGRLGQGMSGIRIVKAYTAEDNEQRVFDDGVDRYFALVARTITGVSGVSAMAIAVTGVIAIVLLMLGGGAVLDGSMTVGDFIWFLLLVGLLAAPVVQIASISTQISEAFAGLDRIREVLAEPTEDEADADRQPCETIRGEVVFEGVGFEYDPGTPVLRDVSFEAPAGTTTALVGSSGSGKSTLVSLVMAFNRPKEGRVLVDGVDLADLKLRDYRSHLGVVLQDDFLFDGSIAENIAYARPGASREEVERVSRVAHCHEFIEEFEAGYETIVGERGVRLSGGQRQRVAIARALLADPQVLILDEATSSLDSESEQMIQDGLARLREGRTTFVIAHRLSTIRSADQILVVEEGRIVERGTHDELLAAGGRYRELYDRQYRFEHERFINPGEEMAAETSAG